MIEWQKKFICYWADLEIVYAVALDEEKIDLNLEDKKIINDAIKNLKELIKSKLLPSDINEA